MFNKEKTKSKLIKIIDFNIKDSVKDVVNTELILIFGIVNLIKNPIKKI